MRLSAHVYMYMTSKLAGIFKKSTFSPRVTALGPKVSKNCLYQTIRLIPLKVNKSNKICVTSPYSTWLITELELTSNVDIVLFLFDQNYCYICKCAPQTFGSCQSFASPSVLKKQWYTMNVMVHYECDSTLQMQSWRTTMKDSCAIE